MSAASLGAMPAGSPFGSCCKRSMRTSVLAGMRGMPP